MGNLRSVEKAVQHLGEPCAVQGDLKGATKLIIPGVGAFGAAMERLAPLKNDITRFARDGGSLLGICLGQQLLFESSEEMGAHEGLGLLPGVVRYLPKQPGLKVPHMGWNDLRFSAGSRLGAGFPEGAQVYFVHSLYTDCADKADVAAWSEYGITFPAAIERGTIWGTQFHPEKSSSVGLALLNNFLQFQP